ncbi:MAG: fatty acid hydroxylase, partial [Ginsengibacter sp.]
MKFEKIHNKGQAQVFRNQYLEYLTKTHPVVIWGMYLPVVGCLPFYGASRFQCSVFTIAVVFILGIFFWTLFEYLMHRFVFHWAANSERGKKFTYVLHGNHHKFPRDKQRL